MANWLLEHTLGYTQNGRLCTHYPAQRRRAQCGRLGCTHIRKTAACEVIRQRAAAGIASGGSRGLALGADAGCRRKMKRVYKKMYTLSLCSTSRPGNFQSGVTHRHALPLCIAGAGWPQTPGQHKAADAPAARHLTGDSRASP